jgi:glycosyltransferase involved in cell wall biosynthesis
MTLIIHAPNVHQGGGRALLVPLLAAADAAATRAILDSRLDMPVGIARSLVAMRVPPTLIGRLLGERELVTLARPGDTVLCFGNLPPLFKPAGRVILFLQNRYLVGSRDLSGFSTGQRLRITLERRWLRTRLPGVAEVVVQSPSVAREIEAELGVAAKVLSFLPDDFVARQRPDVRYDFLYVASGEPHKNHRTLIAAWKLLAREGFRPSLCLTLDPAGASDLLAWIRQEAEGAELRVENAGNMDRARLQRLYTESKALIYPSLFESLGLPLVEAATLGLPVLAPELDYVRDVVVPAQTFDPTSATSIARAVRRHLSAPEGPVTPMKPAEFLQAVIGAR